MKKYTMTEDEKKMLKEKLTTMAYIAKYVKESSLYYRRLKTVNYEYNIKSYDIDYFIVLLQDNMIAEIYKLFSETRQDSHSFYQLKKQLQGTYKQNDLSVFLEKEYECFKNCNMTTRLHGENLDLVNVTHAELIKDIQTVRDKSIAHTEKDWVEMQNRRGDVFKCIEHCIDFAFEMIKELHQRAFEEPMDFDFESSYYGKTNFELLNAFIEKKENN